MGAMKRMMDPLRGTERVLKELLLPALEVGFGELQAAVAHADIFVAQQMVLPAAAVAEKTSSA